MKNDVLVIGDTYIDLISEQKGASLALSDTFIKSLGGDGFLTALAFSRLGAKTSISTLIGSDEFGMGIIDTLIKEGVSLLNPLVERTGFRFSWFEKENTVSKVFHLEETFSHLLPSASKPLTIVFASYLLKNKLINDAKSAFQGGTIAFVLEESVDENDPSFKELLELVALSDLVFSFGKRTSMFLSQLDEALKIKNTSYVIERHVGIFDVLHKTENGGITITNFSLSSYQPAKIPAFVASYCLGWLNKNLAETKAYVSHVIALSANRGFIGDSLPFQSELNEKKSLKEVELIHSKMLSKDLECLCFLTFDQTTHFEELACELHRSEEEIAQFKELIYNAFLKTIDLEHTATLGICVDNSHGKEILAKSLSSSFALMRTVDDETKKEFLEHPYSLVRSWPRKEIVKVLFNLKDGELPTDDIQWLKKFADAVKESGHRFLIEIYDKEIYGREERVLSAIAMIYKQGIRPSLWNLQPSYDILAWSHFEELLDHYDPSAGILILGDQLTIKQLAKELKELREKTRKIKGFAIGRSLWQTVAEHWFEKRISNEMVESEVAHNFRRLLRVWENPLSYHPEEFEDRNLEHLKR